MSILITGGAGFIGSHLTKRLVKEGFDITVIDSFHNYYSVKQKKDQLEEAKSSGAFEFYELDLLDEGRLNKWFQEKRFKTVIHLAAIPGVPASIADPHLYIDYDIKATVNLLRAAGESGVSHFVFASSSSVYGNASGIAKASKEEDAAGSVVSPYAAAKWGAESFCKAYSSLYGFDLTVLRFFTVYGPWVRPDMAIPIFINKLMRKEKLYLFNEHSARDYTYIDDITEGIFLSLFGHRGERTYNLGSGTPVTLNTLTDALAHHFPHLEKEYTSRRKGDVERTWADIGKASADLGYKPKFSIQEGLERTVAWATAYFH
ncbi:SDR family NAD(P)-dependent oxidoreductase [Fictibacillus aquaticus]|uniref:SDR family NAD(P)-dependent oxidoreductase n=1 Tax=Fictibacillus aquaticus TaxID=2021314 RepID=UPI001F0A5CF2|nr:SDR family NAD(P)-dependent oxidoreductase [Fictibacillus aquaticus]